MILDFLQRLKIGAKILAMGTGGEAAFAFGDVDMFNPAAMRDNFGSRFAIDPQVINVRE